MKLVHDVDDIRLYNGDALAIGVNQRAQVFVTDPPYSRAGSLHTGTTGPNAARDALASDQFWEHWFRDAAARMCQVTERCGFVFCDYRTINSVERAFAASGTGWNVSQCLVWGRRRQRKSLAQAATAFVEREAVQEAGIRCFPCVVIRDSN